MAAGARAFVDVHTLEFKYVVLACALLYVTSVRWGILCVEKCLIAPSIRRRASLHDTVFRSGDLLLWSNSSAAWYSDVAKLLCGSPYSHVSMVFVDAAGVPFVWESSNDTGHHVIRLSTKLRKNPDAHCVLRKLNTPLDPARLEQFIRANTGNAYSFRVWTGVVNLWLARLQLPAVALGKRPGTLKSRRFCSQLVADTYEAMGVIHLRTSEKMHSSLIMPSDFANPQDRVSLSWVAPYALGPEIILSCDGAGDGAGDGWLR